jgi:pyocin large subunit-like protein
MVSIKGFASDQLLEQHHADHADDFGAPDPRKYEELARAFLEEPKEKWFKECTRKAGDLVRYDPTSNRLAIMSTTGIIRTFYKPRFCSTVPPEKKGIKKCHNQPTHLAYVKQVCSKT